MKEHLRDLARQKILMAARLKNLHSREESLKGTEQQFKVENENLQHEIQELSLSQSSNAKDVAAVTKEAEQTAAVKVAEAKAKATEDVKDFETKLLQSTQAEILKLKDELRQRQVHEGRAEKDLLQEEHNVQAEEREASEALSRAKREDELAKKQVDMELIEANAVSRNIVDGARRQAAEIREKARAGGFSDGVTQAQSLLQDQAKMSDELSQKETEIKKMTIEFNEKMDHQVSQHEHELSVRAEEDRQAMKAMLEMEIKGKLQKEEKELNDAVAKRHSDFLAEMARAEKEEARIIAVDKENADLRARTAQLKFDVAHQKEEFDRILIETPDI